MTLINSTGLTGTTGFNASIWRDTSAQTNATFALGSAGPWGTIATELARAQ